MSTMAPSGAHGRAAAPAAPAYNHYDSSIDYDDGTAGAGGGSGSGGGPGGPGGVMRKAPRPYGAQPQQQPQQGYGYSGQRGGGGSMYYSDDQSYGGGGTASEYGYRLVFLAPQPVRIFIMNRLVLDG